MACRDGYSESNIILQSAANWPTTASRKFGRGRVHNRDFLRITGTDFDERPSEHVSIYGGSNGLNEKSWKVLNQKIWPEQGRVSWSDFESDFWIFRISQV